MLSTPHTRLARAPQLGLPQIARLPQPGRGRLVRLTAQKGTGEAQALAVVARRALAAAAVAADLDGVSALAL